MWHYNTVETFKRHGDDEECAGGSDYEVDGHCACAVPGLVGRYFDVVTQT